MNASDHTVLVVGDGIAGHLIAIALQEQGYPTTLVGPTAGATGATLRNEGWLHHGTYHSISQTTDAAATAVASRCLQGSQRIRVDYPAAMERGAGTAIALVHESLDEAFVLDRWDLCGIQRRPLTPAQTSALLPELRLDAVTTAFSVADQPIHTGRLLALARRRFAALGGTFRHGRVVSVDDGVEVRHAGERAVLRPWLTVWATGFSGFELVAPLLPPDTHARYWRSHLLLSERITDRSWFELQAGGLGLMDHRTHAVLGLNEDVERVPPPTGAPHPPAASIAEAFRSGVERLFGADLPASSQVVSCTKIDVVSSTAAARDLNVNAAFVRPDLLLALPGKMTEAPVLAADVLALVLESADLDGIPSRLGDRWADAQTLLVGPPPVKATVAETSTSVTKVHLDPATAHVEARVHAELVGLGLRVPAARTATLIDGTATVTYDRIDGPTLAEGPLTPELIREAVTSLARFQRHVQLGASPLGLYRDAFAGNLVDEDGKVANIDLSSTGQFRHQLDDVALLALSLDAEVDEVVAAYRSARATAWAHPSDGSGLVRGLAEIGLPFARVLDSVHRTYEEVVSTMPSVGDWEPERALEGLASISMLELRWADLSWFLDFRAARLHHLRPATAPTQDAVR